MHWPKKIHTREMLTKETPLNTFLMVRFKFCLSMNIVHVIQFVLKVFSYFSIVAVFPYTIMSYYHLWKA